MYYPNLTWGFLQRNTTLAAGLGTLMLISLLWPHNAMGVTNGVDKPILTLRCSGSSQPPQTFSLEQLRQLPNKTITTSLPAGLGGLNKQHWTGVPLRTLAEQSRCGGGLLKILALNAYADTIPAQDLESYDPILAYARDGEAISVRDKGPLIVIYPFDDYPKLNTQVYFNRTVWLVYAIEIK